MPLPTWASRAGQTPGTSWPLQQLSQGRSRNLLLTVPASTACQAQEGHFGDCDLWGLWIFLGFSLNEAGEGDWVQAEASWTQPTQREGRPLSLAFLEPRANVSSRVAC